MTAFLLPAGFGKRPRKLGTKRSQPEQSLQTQTASWLTWVLPPEVPWTAIGHGGGGQQRGRILKATGVHAGWPDLMFIIKSRPVFIEMKAKTGALSPAQKEVHQAITVAGGIVKTCRSIDEVKAFLEVLGVPLRTEKPSTTLLREAGERLGDSRRQ